MPPRGQAASPGRAGLAMLLALLATACGATESTRTYAEPGLGLAFEYSSAWEEVDTARIQRAVDRAAEDGVKIDGVEEALPRIVFSLARPMSDGDHRSSPNLMLMVMPVDAEVCREVNTDRYVAQDAAEYAATVPGARIAPELHVTPASPVRGYTVVLPVQGRLLTQHRYIRCVDDKLVMLQTSSSVEQGHAMLREILVTLRFSAPA